MLAATGHDSVVLWDMAKRDWVGSVQAGWVLALAFSSDSKRLATADLHSHTITVWNLDTSHEK